MRIRSLLLAALLVPIGASAGSPALAAAKAGPVINVVGTADQKFVPATVVLHVGKPQVLRFSSTGGVHGIASTDLGIPQTMIMPDKPVSFTVTPKKAGTYVLPCTIVCGPNHASMSLTVEVKP